jgi:hypothetical protein
MFSVVFRTIPSVPTWCCTKQNIKDDTFDHRAPQRKAAARFLPLGLAPLRGFVRFSMRDVRFLEAAN